jgi:hypothetical protein
VHDALDDLHAARQADPVRASADPSRWRRDTASSGPSSRVVAAHLPDSRTGQEPRRPMAPADPRLKAGPRTSRPARAPCEIGFLLRTTGSCRTARAGCAVHDDPATEAIVMIGAGRQRQEAVQLRAVAARGLEALDGRERERLQQLVVRVRQAAPCGRRSGPAILTPDGGEPGRPEDLRGDSR